ncbi:hypothetical protein MFIFM68171_07970 [Madurella fahalii]|uniref:C2H2-type domain-containing protein n=1 Tax=Madurella fahalii TaxID=1157608 RepID=A0ABQ0GJN6_9PEZI
MAFWRRLVATPAPGVASKDGTLPSLPSPLLHTKRSVSIREDDNDDYADRTSPSSVTPPPKRRRIRKPGPERSTRKRSTNHHPPESKTDDGGGSPSFSPLLRQEQTATITTDPSSPEFQTVLSAFRLLLRSPDHSLPAILEAYFEPQDRELLIPCVGARAKKNPALAELQRENARSYRELLQSGRFEGWEGEGTDLAFRLTLAWFGLPVGPLGDGDEDGEGDEKEEEDESEGEGKGEGELGWLNCYTERTFGRDVVRVPDPELEAYQMGEHPTVGRVFFSGLRGGDTDREDTASESGVSDEEKTSDPASSPLSLRGGAFGSGFVSNGLREIRSHDSATSGRPSRRSARLGLSSPLETPRGGDTASVNERWIPLYGYQGIVWFRIDMFYTFVDAVDRLLCLDNRAGVTYSLYLLDKRKTYETQAERDEFLQDEGNNGLTIWCAGVGDYSHDHLVWEWVIGQLGRLGEDVNGPEVYQKVLFVAGPDDPIPWTWKPGPSHQVMEVVLDWADERDLERPDVAYLRMPDNPTDVVYTNLYSKWMAHICRVLAAGRIPGRPGYPAIPDAWFSVADSVRNTGGHGIGTYGGLLFLPQSWSAVAHKWEVDKYSVLRLQARTGRKPRDHKGRISDRWHLFLPGVIGPYEKQYILHDEVGSVRVVQRTIMDLVRSSMSSESFSKLKSIEVYLPGTGFFHSSESSAEQPTQSVVSLTARSLGSEFQPVVDRLVQWKVWLEKMPGVPPTANGLSMFPQFITIRPVFERYTVCGVSMGTEALRWDPDSTSITEFRHLMVKIWSKGMGKNSYSSDHSLISITQHRPGAASLRPSTTPAYSMNPHQNKPKLIIGPDTDEDQWWSICRMIVEPEVYVSLVDEERMPSFRDYETEQPFGYRDIYKTPSNSLYRALRGDLIPTVTRHYDYQLWDENVTPQLKTVKPWDEQPLSLSAYFGPDRFALQWPTSSPGHSDFLLDSRGTKGGRLSEANANRTRPARQEHLHSLHEAIPESLAKRITFPTATNVEWGMHVRANSYTNPLYLQIVRDIPIDAPAMGTLLNLGRDSLPVVSLSVLTPTEVRRLQRDYDDMRNLILSRAQHCPYPGCDAVYPVSQPLAMQQHLKDTHIAEKCSICDEMLFQHWPPEQRYQHYVAKHSDIFKSLETLPGNEGIEITGEAHIDQAREGRWKFCPRCGRDHRVLNVRTDRAHHDNVCYPGVQDRETDWSACGMCGDRIPKPASGSSTGKRHAHRDIPPETPFCEKCAAPLSLFSEAYRDKHMDFCKGHGRDDAKHCPWCGVELDRQFDSRLEHIEECAEKPIDDPEGPIDVNSRSDFQLATGRRPRQDQTPNAHSNVSRGPEPEPGPAPVSPKMLPAKNPKTTPSKKIATTSKDASYKPPIQLPTRRSKRIRKASVRTIDSTLSPPPSTPNRARSRESRRPTKASAPEAPQPSPAVAAAAAAKAVPAPTPTTPTAPQSPAATARARGRPAAVSKAGAVPTRAGKRKRGAAVEEPEPGTETGVDHAAKAARVVRRVEYAEPLEKGASPPRRVVSLVSAFKKPGR